MSDPALLAQTLIYAGLDALRSTAPLDLCAYLHSEADEGPQLYLGTPSLSSVEPTDAFNLFSALRDAMGDEHDGEGSFSLAGFHATLVSTAGARSRGLHVAGMRDAPLEDPARASVVKLARALGDVVHAIDPSGGDDVGVEVPTSVERVAVEMIDDGAQAEVGVTVGEEFRTGTAQAPTAARAVALAAVDALDASIKVLEATDGNVGATRVVLVLVADQLGRQHVGALVAEDSTDPLRATAAAAIDAAARAARV